MNTGSVGRPNDGDPRAGYVLLEMGETVPMVEFVRVEYDLEEALQGILTSDLPDEFAEYLRTGVSPSRWTRTRPSGSGDPRFRPIGAPEIRIWNCARFSVAPSASPSRRR